MGCAMLEKLRPLIQEAIESEDFQVIDALERAYGDVEMYKMRGLKPKDVLEPILTAAKPYFKRSGLKWDVKVKDIGQWHRLDGYHAKCTCNITTIILRRRYHSQFPWCVDILCRNDELYSGGTTQSTEMPDPVAAIEHALQYTATGNAEVDALFRRMFS